MEVKDYVEKYRNEKKESGRKDATISLMNSFLDEFGNEFDKINNKNEDQVIPLLDDFNRKWKCISDKLEDVTPLGFQNIVFNRNPMAKRFWNPNK